MDLTISSTNLSEPEAEDADLPCYTVSWLRRGKFLPRFFWTNGWNQIFSKQEPPSNTNVDHWMALEISFREDLDIFLCEFNPKLKHKTVFAKHTVVKSFQRLILFESYTMSKLLYTLNLLSKINTKRGLHSHTNL